MPVASIEDQKPGGSLMPKGLANLMTRAEFVDLVRFLSELGKPGPYADPPDTRPFSAGRSQSRFPTDLANSVPGGDAFRDQVLRRRARPLGRGLCQGRRLVAARRGRLPRAAARSSTSRARSRFRVPGRSGCSSIRPRASGSGSTSCRLPPGSAAVSMPLAAGRHSITLRVDTTARQSQEIRVEVVKPAGSTAEFTVVGGR